LVLNPKLLADAWYGAPPVRFGIQPLGRRSGRFPPLPYPPPRSRTSLAGAALGMKRT
jgi:hypothetical protein